MQYQTIISSQELGAQLNNPAWVILDCRFSLTEPDAGFKAYRMGHVPGARFADLEKDFSGPAADYKGRHPLPDFDRLVKAIAAWGIGNTTQVIVYDDMSGAIAGRMWWLLRSLGHYQVAVLDGGYKDWLALGMPVTTVLPDVKPANFRPYPGDATHLSSGDIENAIARRKICLIDARAQERFWGINEPIDPVAGHIPGAINRPFTMNLTFEGRLKSAEKLRAEFNAMIAHHIPGQVVHMCGSGVTACHNFLAMEVAGLSGSRVYPGSWSEWIRNKNRAVA